MSQRILGQNASIIIVRNSIVEATITDIHKMGIVFDSEIIKKGYLGQKTNLVDDVFKGVTGDFEFHTYSQDVFFFLQAIHDRQKRNTPNTVINITVDLLYPNLQNPTHFFPDCAFGAQNMDLSSRTDWINKKIPWASNDYDWTPG